MMTNFPYYLSVFVAEEQV